MKIYNFKRNRFIVVFSILGFALLTTAVLLFYRSPRSSLASVIRIRSSIVSDNRDVQSYDNNGVHLAVVEEHHEVIKYWFEEAFSGNIGKQGNTLVHIDGHSDNGLVRYVQGFPDFRWPHKKELKYFMQQNDNFISAAVSTGLIRRAIWVWPPWDWQNHNTKYDKQLISIGWFIGLNKTEGFGRQHCYCIEINEMDEKICYVEYQHAFDFQEILKGGSVPNTLPKDDQDDPFELRLYNTSRCHIKAKYIWEEILDTEAIKRLRDGHWIADNEKLILDIDEDYFGCESGFDILNSTGLAWKRVELLNKLLNSVVCPKKTAHEMLGDKLLQRVIKTIVDTCKLTQDKDHCKMKEDKKKVMNITLQMFYDFAKNNQQLFCKDVQKKLLDTRIRMTALLMTTLSFKQLKAMRSVGFCMSTTPKSLYFADENKFSVCHGVNWPNNSVVNFHTPTSAEFNKQLGKLRQTVAPLMRRSPNLITLCRSMRDGYTPKSYFDRIETGVKKIISDVMAGSSLQVSHDLDLMGGAGGWPNRYEPHPIL